MNIDEGKLLDLLSRRVKFFKNHFDIVATLLALFGYVVTMIFSWISLEKIPLFAKIAAFGLLILYLCLFIWTVFTSRYSIEAFYNDIVKCSDNHRFSLIILKDEKLRFLLKYDKRWKCYLFPYIRTGFDNDNAVLSFVKINIGLSPIEIVKKLEKEETKHSFSSNMSKTYQHTFCSISYEPKITKDSFRNNKEKYKWFSIDEMKLNKRIMERNSEAVKFVEENF